MYKDKAKQREAVKKAVDRHRVLQKGITSQGITPEGMTRIEFIRQELNDPFLIKGIEGAARLFEDRDRRYEKAYKHKLYRDEYVKTHPMGCLPILSH